MRAGGFTTHLFPIPEAQTTGKLTLASAITLPGDILPACADHRPLGVALHRLVFRGRERVAEIPLSTLAQGWHGLEKGVRGACWRWSDGAGRLSASRRGRRGMHHRDRRPHLSGGTALPVSSARP